MPYYDDMRNDGAPRIIFEGRHRKHTARKDHICTSCGKVIQAGTKYWSHVIMDDEDGFQYSKMHRLGGYCKYDDLFGRNTNG